jgi:hypothetical protein
VEPLAYHILIGSSSAKHGTFSGGSHCHLHCQWPLLGLNFRMLAVQGGALMGLLNLNRLNPMIRSFYLTWQLIPHWQHWLLDCFVVSNLPAFSIPMCLSM